MLKNFLLAKMNSSTIDFPCSIVYAGLEPIDFTNLFPKWTVNTKARQQNQLVSFCFQYQLNNLFVCDFRKVKKSIKKIQLFICLINYVESNILLKNFELVHYQKVLIHQKLNRIFLMQIFK